MRSTLAPLGLATAPGGYEYDVRIVGVGGRLADRLEEASVLFAQQDEPPDTLQGLRSRARSDRDLFFRVMRSRGWYDGEVSWEIDTEADPPLVTMQVTRGVRTTFSRFEIDGLPPGSEDIASPEGLAGLGLAAGAPALAETVLAVEDALVLALVERGHPWAVVASREARLDRVTHTMDLDLRVDAGPVAAFGEVTVEGTREVDEGVVLRRVAFHKGERFSPKKVEETRKALFATGVFSGVTIDWGTRENLGEDGEVPIRIVVSEAEFHSVGAGLKYSTVDGIGGHAFWENRNVRGRGEKLRAEFLATQLQTTGGVSWRIPDWRRTGQTLLLDVRADVDDPPAYKRFAVGASTGIERTIWRNLVGTGGLALEKSEVNSAADPDGTASFTLLGLRLGLRYDGSDDLLDPTRGHRTLVSMTPWVSVLGDSVEMLSLRVTESFYVPLRRDRRVVWATRSTAASVIGPERNDVPADKRLYAGGGDTVRGYEYQFVGPLVDVDPTSPNPRGRPDYKPLGGRSMLQVGTELRWKVTETFGVVPFLEGAGVYESSYPDFGEDSQWAAGLGLRYFTVAGPLRFDIAFPLNPRQSDDVLEFYISLGQAF